MASTSRGAQAITRAGGATVRVLSQRMIRAPMWEFGDVESASRFGRWVSSHMGQMEHEVAMVSSHARLTALEPLQIGRFVHVRFVYETGDAAGQNMTTACTWRACQWIDGSLSATTDLRPTFFMVEGNSSGDKKADYLGFILGRGFRVTAECFLDRATVGDVLKSTPEAMEHGHRCAALAAQQCGMLGHSVNVANIVAAIFTATGQDIACVHESGVGILSLEAVDSGLHATMVLPRLVVGSVGGGTALPSQHDCLEVIGCAGEGKGRRLAEIICSFALALDLSTGAAVVGGQFADAHERLGRSRPVRWLRDGDLGPTFLEPILARGLGKRQLRVLRAAPLDCPMGSSIITQLTAASVNGKLTGLYPLRVTVADSGGERVLELVAKVKALDDEVMLEARKLASSCGGGVAEVYERWQEWIGFRDVHTRELAVYRSCDEALLRVLPAVYGVHEDPSREAYVILMERLGDNVFLKDTAYTPQLWTRDHIDAALTGIAAVHANWLGREEELFREGWLGRIPTGAQIVEMSELWEAILKHNAATHPELVDAATHAYLRQLILELPGWRPTLDRMPQTLVHGDFNLRNVALRRASGQLVAYDWELATVHVPQRDLVEFLAFVLPPSTEAGTVAHHIEEHRQAVQRACRSRVDPRDWRYGYELALWEFAITRLQLYLMAHTFREHAFVERAVQTVERLLAIERVARREPVARSEQ